LFAMERRLRARGPHRTRDHGAEKPRALIIGHRIYRPRCRRGVEDLQSPVPAPACAPPFPRAPACGIIVVTILSVASMRRRDFVLGFGGTMACALPARAQESPMPVIGLVSMAALDENYTRYLAAWRAGLAETGYIEDQNVSIEYHWLEGRYDRLAT